MRRVVTILFLLVAALSNAQDKGAIRLQTAPGITATGGTLTGPLLIPDGTNAAPGLGFATESNMGFYKVSAQVGCFTANSTCSVLWNSSGDLVVRSTGRIGFTAGVGTASIDTSLYRDAANTLALRNSTNAQTFNVYGSYTSGTNYGRFAIVTSATGADLVGQGLGATAATGGFRSLQGSVTKALSEGSPTTVATVAVPQTAGANFAAGEVLYTVYASDGTDTQTLNGSAFFSAVNKAGTEACQLTDDQIGTEAASTGTLVCTVACAVGLTDVVGITFDCTSSLTQTSLNALVRFDMQQVNTLVFP